MFVLGLIGLPAQAKELIQGGESKRKIDPCFWRVTKKYGQDIEQQVKDGTFSLLSIDGPNPKYLTFYRWIALKPNTKYVLKFESKMREDTAGKVTFQVGRLGFARPKQEAEIYDHLGHQKLT